MGLSAAFVEAHIAKWEKHLAQTWAPYRGKWPSRLFHHAPLENAVEILKSGALLSRNDAKAAMKRDIAGDSVIDASTRAHAYARLYFRPRTPTQYHIEGARKKDECKYGHQAPVLYMFVLDARQVLSRDGTKFADQNMQSGIVEQEGEGYFGNIPFDKVFHDSGINGDFSIIKHRCAEVLVPSPLKIDETVQFIYCRSEAERDTLIYSAGASADGWEKRIVVSDDLRLFHKTYAFVEQASLTREGLIVKLHPRQDNAEIAVRVELARTGGPTVLSYNGMLKGRPSATADRYRFKVGIEDGFYTASVWLEDELSFSGVLYFDETPF